MKKHLVVAAGLAVLSTSAFASKARLQALGQDIDGSIYLDDTRSVFLNPAKLNSMSNYVVTEWGDSSVATDGEATPQAEGGFFRSSGAFSYGVYFGNESGLNNAEKTTAAVQETENNLELFFAGDMGVKWGARVQYASSKNEPEGGVKEENDVLGLGLGIESGAIEAYANLLLKDESKGGAAAGDKYEADSGLDLGASYEMKDLTFYGQYEKSGYTTTVSAAKTKEVEVKDMTFGVAKTKDISETAKMFVNLAYTTTETTDKVADSEVKEKALPLTVGFESQATSWLTLRASVSQNIIIGETETKGTGTKTDANSTSVNAGGTLTFGKLMVDGVIGTTDESRATTGATKSGVLATDNLMTRVAVSYWF